MIEVICETSKLNESGAIAKAKRAVGTRGASGGMAWCRARARRCGDEKPMDAVRRGSVSDVVALLDETHLITSNLKIA